MILENTKINSYIHEIEVEVVNSYTTSVAVTLLSACVPGKSTRLSATVSNAADVHSDFERKAPHIWPNRNNTSNRPAGIAATTAATSTNGYEQARASTPASVQVNGHILNSREQYRTRRR